MNDQEWETFIKQMIYDLTGVHISSTSMELVKEAQNTDVLLHTLDKKESILFLLIEAFISDIFQQRPFLQVERFNDLQQVVISLRYLYWCFLKKDNKILWGKDIGVRKTKGDKLIVIELPPQNNIDFSGLFNSILKNHPEEPKGPEGLPS
jgi:hypothetical protein